VGVKNYSCSQNTAQSIYSRHLSSSPSIFNILISRLIKPFVVSLSNHERLNNHPPSFDKLPSTGFLRQAQDERLSLICHFVKKILIDYLFPPLVGISNTYFIPFNRPFEVIALAIFLSENNRAVGMLSISRE
jgi:hypothetical protein